ncbi:MAG: alpha/beta hydrolase [Alphaproteobacteria bacterium]
MSVNTSRFTSIPEDEAEVLEVETAPGVTLLLYRLRASRPSGPVILFGHANGLAAGSYLPLLEILGAHARIFAFDARAHGGSSVPGGTPLDSYGPDALTHDLAAIIAAVRAHIGEAPLYYAAHSKCAVEAIRLAGIHGSVPWKAATLFEPPLLPPRDHPLRAVIDGRPLNPAMISRQRRARWHGYDELARSLAGKPIFRDCRADMLEAHCRATLRPMRAGEDGGKGAGDYVLCCPPEIEAQVYEAFACPSNFEAVAHFPGPLNLVGMDPDEAPEEIWLPAAVAAAATTKPDCRHTEMPGLSHMMLLEDPERCANVILEML